MPPSWAPDDGLAAGVSSLEWDVPYESHDSGAAPLSFEELLVQLQKRHHEELQTLRCENDTLRAWVEEKPFNGKAAVQVSSQWRDNSQGQQTIGKAAVGGSPDQPQSAHPVLPENATKTPEAPVDFFNIPEVKPHAEKRTRGLLTSFDGATHVGPGRRGSWASSESLRPAKSANFFEDIAPRTINFHTLCMEKYPEKQWDDLSVHEKVNLIRAALRPRHFLINPHCKVMKFWDGLLALALAFVGLVTPYEVVFITQVDWAFFGVNRFVDLIFILDICLQFFLQVEIQRPHRGGSLMLRDPVVLRTRYVKSWFCIDILSIFPFDILSIILTNSSPVWQRAKILRCLKLLRLAKLLRMLRTWHIQQRWKNMVSIRFGTQRLLRFCMVMLLVSHWMACFWGLTGLSFGAELCDNDGQLIISDPTAEGLSGVSWVTTLFLGGKTSPDNPCNHFEVYIASLHWAVMTLTSIGYGDIVPVRVEEYIVGICCMIVGGVLWAYVIGCVCSIISNASPVERMFEANTDLLNGAMEEACVPRKERHKYREYLREAKAYDRRLSFGHVAAKFSPMLRKHLMYHVTKEALDNVYYFCDPNAPSAFLVHVASCLTPKFFARLESLDSLRHCLCLMDRGTVAHGGIILVHPSVFHEDFIITQKKFHKVTQTISLTYTQILVLTREDMEEILEPFPAFAKVIHKHALKAAFCRAVHMTMSLYKDYRKQMPDHEPLSLSLAFDRACIHGSLSLPRLLSPPRGTSLTWRNTPPAMRAADEEYI